MIQATTCTYRKILVFPIFPLKTCWTAYMKDKVILARLVTRLQNTVNKIDMLQLLLSTCTKNNVGIIYQLLKKETHLIDKVKLLIF